MDEFDDLDFVPSDREVLHNLVDPEDDGICCCKICRRKPSEIQEYIDLAKEEDITPEQYVTSDGTYNYKTKKFYCTSCYIKIGMPLGTA